LYFSTVAFESNDYDSANFVRVSISFVFDGRDLRVG
jgi:hypothetical protein